MDILLLLFIFLSNICIKNVKLWDFIVFFVRCLTFFLVVVIYYVWQLTKYEVLILKEDRILYQIKGLEKIIDRIFLNDKDNCCENIGCFFNHVPTHTQMQIIGYILDNYNKDIYQKDLESILNLRRATVSGVLKTMERNGLVLRVINDDDARSKRIILNDRAKEIFEYNDKKIAELEKIAVNGISNEELTIFSKVLKNMKNNLKNIDK